MKLRLDLVFPAVLIATAGSELVAPDAMSSVHAEQACQVDERSVGATRHEAEERIFADGYTEISSITKACDGSWHALALADGDPVTVRVTPQGAVVTE